MTNLEKDERTEAVNFIESFKKKEINDADMVTKNGHGWDWDADALESAERMDTVISEILDISLNGQAFFEDVHHFYQEAIRKKILARNDLSEILPLMSRYKQMNSTIAAIIAAAKEIMDIHHQYDSITMSLRKYIDWVNKKEEAERLAEREAAKL